MRVNIVKADPTGNATILVTSPVKAQERAAAAEKLMRWSGGWAEQVEERYRAFVADAQHRGLDAKYDCALEIDSWHILQPLRPFGGVGNWR